MLKLAPPDTTQCIPRTHLESLLNDAKGRRIVSVCAPAGSGKSSFIAHYLAKQKTKQIWLNLDKSDSDPANFFQLLSKGIEEKLTPWDFPIFSPEYLQSLSIYSGRFFHYFFKKYPKKIAIVLDNLQKIPEDSPVHQILLTFMKELSGSARLFIISRSCLPFASAKWNIERIFLRLEWGHLRFRSEEIKKLLEFKGVPNLSQEQIDAIALASRGLVANVLFDLKKFLSEKSKDIPQIEHKTDLELEFSSLSPKELDLLMRLAEFKEISEEQVISILGKRDGLDILKRYAQEGFFVVPIDQKREIYRIHDLFREFLQKFIKTKMEEKEYYHHMMKIASFFLENERYDEAIDVLARIGALEEIVKIIREKGLKWLHEGRFYLLENTLRLFKDSIFESNPWILYFKSALIRFNQPQEAMELLSAAFSGFKQNNDIKGMKLALGEFLDLAQYWGEDFSYVGDLLKEVDKIMSSSKDNIKDEIDMILSVHAGVMYLLHKSDPLKSIQYIKMALNQNKVLKEMPLLHTYVLLYAAISFITCGQCVKAEEYFQQAELFFKNCPEHPPHVFMFHFLASTYEVFAGRFGESVKRIKKTIRYARKWGLFMQEEHLHIRLLEGLVCQGETKEAKKVLDTISNLQYRNPFSMAMTYQLHAQWHLIVGNPLEASQAAENSATIFDKIQTKAFADPSWCLYAVALAEMGEFDTPIALLTKVIHRSKIKGHTMQTFSALIQLSHVYYLKADEDQAKDTLKEALSLGKQQGFKAIYNWYPSMMSKICLNALKNNIQTNYVNSLISFHNLTPSEPILSDKHWPWPIKIYTFGRLRVMRHDEEISIKEWKGTKSLDLFKAILSLGTSTASLEFLADLLWPDIEGDKAMQNIEFTLRRLRATLSGGNKKINILPLKARILSFNKDVCWIDCLTFKEYILLSEKVEGRGEIREANVYRQKAIEIYKGFFLTGFNEPWVITARERWHQSFLQVADLLANYLFKKEQWIDLIYICRKVLSLEPFSSRFLLLLMKGLASSGRIEEALSEYERFEKVFKKSRNNDPPKEIQNYYHHLKKEGFSPIH